MKRIEMPPDFAAHAGESLEALSCIYGISKTTARKWRTQLGVSVKRGAPAGNRNHIGGGETRKRGSDDPWEIRTCLSCTAKNCRGRCAKVH